MRAFSITSNLHIKEQNKVTTIKKQWIEVLKALRQSMIMKI